MGFWRVYRSALAAAALRLPAGVRGVPGRAPLRGCNGGTSRGDEPGQPVCYALSHRALLKLQGADTSAFLQGIITNDVTLLDERAAVYAHLLNVQGRTLYDVILYSLQGAAAGDVLLECDSSVTDSVLKHLQVYRVRRKVSVRACPELSVWAVLPATPPELSTPERVAVWEEDPRTPLMGRRLVLRAEEAPEEVVRRCQRGDEQDYHRHRYTLGVPEGVADLPPGVALPLESNLVYLQGISFSKGCYIGQELTARTHHTGVVRKRLMPVRLSSTPLTPQGGAMLQTQAGKPAGKHRVGVGDRGLSLVRTAHATETLTLTTDGGEAVTLRAAVPPWWPTDEDA